MHAFRVYVDLLKRDGANRILLTTEGTRQDLQRTGVTLQEGMVLQVYSDDMGENGQRDDLVAEGIVRRDDTHSRWVLELDEASLRHESTA